MVGAEQSALAFLQILWYNESMKKNYKTILCLLALLFVGSAILGNTPTDADTTAIPEQNNITEIVATHNDYTLQIPQIGITTQMTEIVKIGSNLPVPENNPGYYSIHDYNLFIVGHNHTIFKRLDEKPNTIIIWQNGQPKTYYLVGQETKPKDQISMDTLLNYHGIVIMTCAGDYGSNGYTHRLLLYYHG